MKKNTIDFSKQCSLEELHKIMKTMLIDIDKVCEEEELDYFLIDGTLLGAARHKGFIPWDDDVDIAMPRKDYEKFVKIAQEKIGNKYFVQTLDTDKEYDQFYIPLKIRDNNSTLIEVYGKKYHEGVFVDVFPFDFLDDRVKKQIMHKRIMHFLSVGKGPISMYRFPSLHFWARLAVQLVGRMIPLKLIVKYSDYVVREYKSASQTEYMTYGYELPWRNIFKTQDIYPLKKIEFEDVLLNCPNNETAILTEVYGDYMQLPPKEKQFTHAKFYSNERLF